MPDLTDFSIAHEASATAWLDTSLGPAGPSGTRLAHGPVELSTSARKCGGFQNDCQRILHSQQLARAEGILQVFYATEDVVTNRKSHSIQVASIAGRIARALGLDETLARAIGLAHDVGHMPFGHVGETVVRSYGFDADHSVWGADNALADLGLSAAVLDGVRTSPWSSAQSPTTPEGEVASWADRIAYLTFDIEDAIKCGVLSSQQVADALQVSSGQALSQMRSHFVNAVITASRRTNLVAMEEVAAERLAALRKFNHSQIYRSRPVDAQAQEYASALSVVMERAFDRGYSCAGVGSMLQSMTDTEVLIAAGLRPEDLDIRKFLGDRRSERLSTLPATAAVPA